jgi:hypothetical protein
MSNSVQSVSRKSQSKKNLHWIPTLKRQLENKFAEKYFGNPCDTAHFILNDEIAIICHKFYKGRTNYYPDN